MRRVLPFVLLLVTASVCSQAATLYVWQPNPGSGGIGSIELEPIGADATDDNFSASSVISLYFQFVDPLIPTITLADLAQREAPGATGGKLIDINFGENATRWPNTQIIFAAGSADFNRNFNPLYPTEIHAGGWLLSGHVPPTSAVPESDKMGLVVAIMVGLMIGVEQLRKMRRAAG